MLQRILLFTALLSIISTITPTGRKTCTNMSVYSCNICYQFMDSSEKEAVMTQCRYQYCARSQKTNSGSKCIKKAWKDLPEKECFATCCGKGIHTSSSFLDNVGKCKAENKKMLRITIGIVGGIFGCILLVFVLCCLNNMENFAACMESCCCDALEEICCCCCNAEQNEPNDNQASRTINLSVKNKYQWETVENDLKVSTGNITCAICLNEGINVETNCAHFFHLDCIWQWSRRNPTCPLCISSQLNPAKLFCRNCCSRYISIDLSAINNTGNLLNEVKGPNCPSCQ